MSGTALAIPDQDIQTLPALVDRAANALASARTAAEVLEARELAGVAYDIAKRTARLAKATAAHDTLIAAAHRAQANALEIEAGAKRRLADEYDAAQERGEVQSPGGDRVSNVPNQNNAPTVSDIGLTRKDIHEARLVRNAEATDPGIVKRTVDAALAAGEEPTKAKVRAAVLQVVQSDRDELPAAHNKRGPRMPVPAGVLVSDYVRGGIAMERAGQTAEEVAKSLGIGVLSYRQCKDIVLLSERTDLGSAAAVIVHQALTALNETGQPSLPWESVRPLIDRVWGGKGARREQKTERRRVEQFQNAISVITESCAHGGEIDIPHMSADDKKSTIENLKRAERDIRDLRERIEREVSHD